MSLTSKYSGGFRVFQEGTIHMVALHFLTFPYHFQLGIWGKGVGFWTGLWFGLILLFVYSYPVKVDKMICNLDIPL